MSKVEEVLKAIQNGASASDLDAIMKSMSSDELMELLQEVNPQTAQALKKIVEE